MTPATPTEHGTTPERVLLMALDLSEKTGKFGCTTGPGLKPRERGGAARNPARILPEVAQAKQRCGRPDSAPVVRCAAAGREGFWLHRFLQAQGITNHVVDSSSIEVNRRQRRAKSDGLDVRKLLSMLLRVHHGAREVWRVGHGPAVAAEDGRHLHRDLETLKQERASTTPRIKGVLSSQGIRLTSLRKSPEQLDPCGCGMGRHCRGGYVVVYCACMRLTRFCVSTWRRRKPSVVPCWRPPRKRASRRSVS